MIYHLLIRDDYGAFAHGPYLLLSLLFTPELPIISEQQTDPSLSAGSSTRYMPSMPHTHTHTVHVFLVLVEMSDWELTCAIVHPLRVEVSEEL